MTAITVTLNPCVDKTCAVPRVVAERKLSCEDVREYPGGGGVNVARILARLGVSAPALFSCGGEMGRRLTALLEEEGVRCAPIAIEGEVRQNLIVTDASSGEQYRFGMPGPRLTDDDLARWRSALADLPSADPFLVVVSGSLPGGVSGERFEELLRAVPKEARLVVDTKKGALHHALRVGAYLIKPNAHELEEICGRELGDDDAVESAARELIDGGGVENVVVSLGRGGALWVSREQTERFAAPSVRIRSKVGAGDSMVGALVAGLEQGWSLADAVRRGVAAGAAAVMTEGTELSRAEDIAQLYKSVCRQERLP